MNLLLLRPAEIDADGRATIADRRAEHLRRVLGKRVGDTVKVGVREGHIGEAEIESIDAAEVGLRCRFDRAPPAKHPCVLVLALPRPPVLGRVVQHVTALGIEHLVLLHTARVEKSYWQSPQLAPGKLEEQIVLGLEQAVDTVAPRIWLRPRFRPFVEDELPTLLAGRTAVFADPSGTEPSPVAVRGPSLFAVGPEGGFVPFERDHLAAAGLSAVTLGLRVLRVETAVVALLGRALM